NGLGILRARYKGNEGFQLNMSGTVEDYVNSGQVDMNAGRFFTDTEDQHHLPVVVIGWDLYKTLFGTENAIGKKITVVGHEVEVIGVMNPPAAAVPGQSDNRVFLPYFTMHKMFPQAQDHVFVVTAKEGKMAAALDEVRSVLRQERHVKLSQADNFFMSTSDQLVETFRSFTSVVALVLVVLSSVGLLV